MEQNKRNKNYGKIFPTQEESFLKRALAKGWLSHTSLFFVEKIFSSGEREFADRESEEGRIFLAYLFEAALRGYLSLKVSEKDIFPAPQDFLSFDQGEENFCEEFCKKIFQGKKDVSKQFLEVKRENLLPKKPLCAFEDHFYLQKNWVVENQTILQLEKLLKKKKIVFRGWEKKLEKKILEKTLTREQGFVVEKAFFHPSLFLICGGPGTGKTYTAIEIIDLFTEVKKDPLIVVSAPTGKATELLKEKILSKGEKFSQIQAKTLHSLLKIKPNEQNLFERHEKIQADLLIVDEASMIDAFLFAELLSALKDETMLVLMGDPHQLPPVGMGSVFSFLALQKQFADRRAFLETCKRFSSQKMQDFSLFVKQGEGQKAVSLLKETGGEITFSSLEEKSFQDILTYFDGRKYFGEKDPKILLQEINSFRILSCLRQGFWGADFLNQKIFENSTKRLLPFEWWAAPILLTEKGEEGLKNGDMGILFGQKQIEKNLYQNARAYFWKEGKKELFSLSFFSLPQFEFGYVLSVHKSQGSEFERVLLLVPPGSEVFGREILYTAVTRAKKKLEIWGEERTLVQMIQKSSCKTKG